MNEPFEIERRGATAGINPMFGEWQQTFETKPAHVYVMTARCYAQSELYRHEPAPRLLNMSRYMRHELLREDSGGLTVIGSASDGEHSSPRHADILLYTGAVTRSMRVPALRAYHAAPDPKVCVAYGACGCSGGIFHDAYCVWGGADQILPIDAYIPGCPPRPEQLIQSVIDLQNRIKKTGTLNGTG